MCNEDGEVKPLKIICNELEQISSLCYDELVDFYNSMGDEYEDDFEKLKDKTHYLNNEYVNLYEKILNEHPEERVKKSIENFFKYENICIGDIVNLKIKKGDSCIEYLKINTIAGEITFNQLNKFQKEFNIKLNKYDLGISDLNIVNVEFISTNVFTETKEKMMWVVDTIKEIEKEYGGYAPLTVLKDMWKKCYYGNIEDLMDRLQQRGIIYEPRKNYWKVV